MLIDKGVDKGIKDVENKRASDLGKFTSFHFFKSTINRMKWDITETLTI